MAKSAVESLLANVSTLAKAQGLSQAALAKKSRLSQRGVHHLFHALENGTAPTLRTIESLARALRVPVAQLFSEETSTVVPRFENALSLARQLSRLTEDFLLSSDKDRSAILRLAEDGAARAETKGRGAA
jgi:transcriptional regulator with XRE-family HTH domain